RITRLRTVVVGMRRVRIDRVRGLFDAPPAARHYDRILDDVTGFQRDLVAMLIFLIGIVSDELEKRHLCAARIAEANVCQRPSFALIYTTIFYAHARGEA